MPLSTHTPVRERWMKQKALELLDIPLAEPWPEVAPLDSGPLDGSTVDFAGNERERGEVRILLLTLERDREVGLAGRFLILAPPWHLGSAEDARIASGHTLALIEGHEIIRYQPVIFDAKAVRIRVVVEAGIVLEADAEDVSAWTGESLRSQVRPVM